VMVSLRSGALLSPLGETHNQKIDAANSIKTGIASRDRFFILY